jgi:hypothetical protein
MNGPAKKKIIYLKHMSNERHIFYLFLKAKAHFKSFLKNKKNKKNINK